METRERLFRAALDLFARKGFTETTVEDITEAADVGKGTFFNYFPSKEAAIVWPTTLRSARLASDLAGRPAGESLADALVEVVAGLYGPGGQDGLPENWLDEFRALAAAEPALHGEYLKAQAAGERALAGVIARRIGAAESDLEPLLLAGVVAAAERAAVLHWFRQAGPSTSLADVVRTAVAMAVRGMTGPGVTLS